MINNESSNNDVVRAINEFLDPLNINKHDNHHIPQYLYIIDEEGKIPETIYILNQYTLTSDMRDLGFTDFDVHSQTHTYSGMNYFKFLNRESIRIINKYYEKDFEYFGYEKLNDGT
jgi:hypothetical protein